jgi:hypothetical protein
VVAKVDILNLALGHCGELTTVSDADKDQTPGARAFRRYYGVALETTLAAADWGFAHREGVPGASKATVTLPVGWAYGFAYPPDCVAFRGAFPAAYSTRPIPAKIVNLPDDEGYDTRLILANQPAPWVVYTRRVDDPVLFSGSFVDAFAWKLATHMAMAFARSRELRSDAEAEFQRLIAVAQAQALREQPKPRDGLPDLIAARRGGYCGDLPPGDDWSTWAGWGGGSVPRA